MPLLTSARRSRSEVRNARLADPIVRAAYERPVDVWHKRMIDEDTRKRYEFVERLLHEFAQEEGHLDEIPEKLEPYLPVPSLGMLP
ncbi:hypothetical protein NLI96_g2137 [Meripilus lineatus]|uniref:Uncharacterized protein n=1 Tax=Meripilus lineatus TaxID=2056292 RepID=A0AAD5YHR0_9APHY|nr:hypothetical protein NLI96_g2137 [Physisporinus lineatus]